METEAALLWGFLVLLLVVLATIIGLLVHSGLFISVEVKTCKPDIGEVQIAYKFARGPYKDSGALFTQVHTLLPEYRTLGVYYDDPKMKHAQKLRYIVGLILSENGKPVVPEHKKLLEENGYQFATFPAIDHAVQTSFPFNSTISIIVAIMKVYPALREYIECRSLCARPFLEVYDNEKSRIIFIGPLAQQDDFYVPEVQQEEDEDHQEEYDDDDHTEHSSRSWEESASFVRGGELNESEYSESVGGDSFSNLPPPPPSSYPSEVPTESPPTVPSSLPAPLLPDSASDVPAVDVAAVGNPTVDAPAVEIPSFDIPAVEIPSVEIPVAAPIASVPPPVSTGTATEAADSADSASVGGEESDANTGSSFEEIDEKEAAAIPNSSSKDREASLKKDEDEGER